MFLSSFFCLASHLHYLAKLGVMVNCGVYILDDNLFFNKMLTYAVDKYMKHYFESPLFNYGIHSYTDAKKIMKASRDNHSIYFLDYYLGKEATAKDILLNIANPSDEKQSIAVLSRKSNNETVGETYLMGASTFICKDKNVIHKSITFLKETLNNYGVVSNK